MAGSLSRRRLVTPPPDHAVVSIRLPVVLPAASLLCRFCRKPESDVVVDDAPRELSRLLNALSSEELVPSPLSLLPEERLEIRLLRSASSPPPGGGGRPAGE